ncbi:hypothetical protein C064_00165 [Brucella suis 63/252]|nr:hypothetical protein DK67_4 [Brucella suis bv. 3 str. 686]AIJ82440.1 hypothetical protein DK60_298 [Brucella canis]AIJ98244.1 hypothetical protein DO76_733 [Brucella suis]ENQ56718.1 hypothetical protein C969_00161 [Brucella canis CNGB 1172]ENQ61342.1 hypothetical protein C979_01721 [Brucella canis UK10/02]ENR17759.1 hypothetical protein C064_00165 [Brucella suis 63/252]ENS47534.1 hypothetical protein B976_01725 [Brucella canis 79/122]ENS53213.1 hypothetical protein C968_00136 [Brucella ca
MDHDCGHIFQHLSVIDERTADNRQFQPIHDQPVENTFALQIALADK